MRKRFEGISDIDLVLMIHETKKAGHPEDKEFIKEVHLELKERQRAFYKREGAGFPMRLGDDGEEFTLDCKPGETVIAIG